jgi:hypothetical protein
MRLLQLMTGVGSIPWCNTKVCNKKYHTGTHTFYFNKRISKMQTTGLIVQRIKSELSTIRNQSFTPESRVHTVLARQLIKSRDANAPNYCRVKIGKS